MYVEQSGLSIGLNAASAGLNLGMDSMNAYDGLMKEKAKSDMFYAQAQLNANTQEFLRDLEQRNDYENYETYAKQFLTKQKNALQKNIKNNYTAELYSQLFTTAENSLNNTIQTARMQKEYEAIGTQNASAIALNNNTLSGQNAIDANNSIINSEYANGMRNSGYTKAALLQDGTNNALKEVYSNASNVMETVFNNGGDFSDVQKYIDDFVNNSEYSIKMLSDAYASPEGMKYAQEHGEGYIEIGNEIDKKKIKENVTEGLKKQWEVQIKARQEKNMGLVTEGYTKLIEMPAEQRISYANAWLRKIDTDMSGNNLSYSQRKQAVDMFKLFTNGDAASGSGSKDWEKALANIYKEKSEYFINKFRNGEISAYDAETTLNEEMLAEFKRLTGSENIDELRRSCPGIERFLDSLYKEAPDVMKGAVKDLRTKFEEIADNLKLEGVEELEAKFIDLAYDCLSVMKLSDEEAVKAALDKLYTDLNSFEGKKLDLVRRNPQSGKLQLQNGIFGNPLYDYLSEIENQDNLVYTDRHGEVKLSVFATDGDGLKRGAELESQFIMKELGISDNKAFGQRFKMDYEEQLSKDDVKATHIFTERNTGKQYKLMADKETKSVKMYQKNPSGKWEVFNTKQDVEKKEAEVKKADIKNQALSVAEKLDAKKIREAGITDIEWQKHVKDPKWLAGAIADKVGRYEKSKNQLEKDNIKRQLEALGYTF